jgi:hypothetical protein
MDREATKRVKFTKDSHLRAADGSAKESYEAGKVYDLSFDRCARWVRRGRAEYVDDGPRRVVDDKPKRAVADRAGNAASAKNR